MKYKILEDLTSDVMFEAYGKDLKEVFSNAAQALLSIICKIKEVESTKKDIKKAQKAVEIDDVDEAVNFLKKFSK